MGVVRLAFWGVLDVRLAVRLVGGLGVRLGLGLA